MGLIGGGFPNSFYGRKSLNFLKQNKTKLPVYKTDRSDATLSWEIYGGAESLCCTPETNLTQFGDYTSI